MEDQGESLLPGVFSELQAGRQMSVWPLQAIPHSHPCGRASLPVSCEARPLRDTAARAVAAPPDRATWQQQHPVPVQPATAAQQVCLPAR